MFTHHRKGPVWEYFTIHDDVVLCKHCSKVYKLKTAKASTSPLWFHLRSAHSIQRKASSSEMSIRKSHLSPMPILQNLPTKPSQEEMYARLAAKDRLSFSQIANSEFIRFSMVAKGFTGHANCEIIKSMVTDYYEVAKDTTRIEIWKLKFEGQKFALSLDEWVGKLNRNYLTINVHGTNTWYNLGMIRIRLSQTPRTMLEVISDKILEFGLTLESDVVAIVSGSTPYLQELVGLAPCEHVICLSHTLHLCISDCLYRQQESVADIKREDTSSSSLTTSDNEEDDADDGIGFLPDFVNSEPTDGPPGLVSNIDVVVKKVRRIVSLFRRSSVKDDVLQAEVFKLTGKQQHLKHDCRTRWSTLYVMLKEFLEIKEAIICALEILNLSHLQLSEAESQTARSLVDCLEPFQVAGDYLSGTRCTLAEADAVIEFLHKQLSEMTHVNSLAVELRNILLTRYQKRAHQEFISLAKSVDGKDPFLPKASNKACIHLAKSLTSRLFPAVQEEPKDEMSSTSVADMDLAGKLYAFVKKERQPDESDNFLKEINYCLTSSKGAGTGNTSLLQALQVVPPTTLQSQRSFRAAGCFVINLRTALSDTSLGMLMFLKFFFNRTLADKKF